MDRSEFIKNGYTVEPGENGSWAIWQGGVRFLHKEQYILSRMICFSNYHDMLKWLTDQHGYQPASDEKVACDDR